MLNVFDSQAQQKQLAFPGAEGFGRFATGGRGGKVYEVTSLADSGPGTLRDGLEAFPGEPLTFVFKVGGIINLQSELRIRRSNLTIAGQTAPGDGICLKGHSFMINGARAISQGGNHGNIIIRYIRSRPGSTLSTGVYGFDMENCHNVIVDHCSFSWANEECAAMYDIKNVTVQWSIVSEGLYNAGHAKGLRSYGGVWGGQYASYHHNLIANQQSRAIRFNGARAHDTIAVIDYRNNVVYNSGSAGAAYGGEVEIPGGVSKVNIVNNYYKPGPAAASLLFISASYNAGGAQGIGQWHLAGNYMYGSSQKTADNWSAADLQNIPSEHRETARSSSPFELNGSDITIQSAEAAYESVLLNAGANFPVRDAVDKRIVSETATGTASAKGATSGRYGIIDSPEEVGGWPAYNPGESPLDTDHDGIPDNWELANSLNPADPADANQTGADGYTMLEIYLNSLAATASNAEILQGFGVVPKSGSETAAEIKWTTLNESNIQKFEVERSADNLNFSILSEVTPRNQSSISEYLYTDNISLPNTSYYRLKITDLNNAVTYSSAVSFYRAVADAYWTEPFTSTKVTSIAKPAAVASSVQSNGEWIFYGARREERAISLDDPNNQWTSGSANPSLQMLNNNDATRTEYGLTEPAYVITPVFNQGISRVTFNELQRSSISANSILVYTSKDGGVTWSATGISNPVTSTRFPLVSININDAQVNRLKITKPATVTMNIDNLTIYGPVGVVLPLQFLSFDAKLTGFNQVNLSWSTANEVNTRDFVVERSNDGNTFYSVGTVMAKQQSGRQTYQLQDTEPIAGLAYYRLKQNDQDGRFAYFDRILTVKGETVITGSVFPNPVTEQLTVTYPLIKLQGSLQISTLTGSLVKTLVLQPQTTSQVIDVADLPRGVYIVEVRTDGIKNSQRVAKN